MPEAHCLSHFNLGDKTPKLSYKPTQFCTQVHALATNDSLGG